METIMIGAFGTFGFGLCQQLLEWGERVHHINVGDEFVDGKTLEERRLFIGRNSNFFDGDQRNVVELSGRKKRVIVPMVDWEYLEDGQRKTVLKRISDYLENNRNNSTYFFTFIVRDTDTFDGFLTSFLVDNSSIGKRVQRIILPEYAGKQWPDGGEGKRTWGKSVPFLKEVLSLLEKEKPGVHHITEKMIIRG